MAKLREDAGSLVHNALRREAQREARRGLEDR